MPRCEELRKLRDRLLGAVFLIAADEDDMLPLAGAVLPFEHDRRIGRERECREHENRKADVERREFHDRVVGGKVFLTLSPR